MRFHKFAFVCAILALSILEQISARKSFGVGRHSYPKSGGLSGHGGSSGHSYPSSGGLSGGGHGYPSSGGNHGYPSSGGLSGSGGRGYPSSGGSYPSSGGAGKHGYPSSGGLSGNNNNNRGGSTTNVHHHYHYNPPTQISYSPVRGAPAQSYPVYRGTPPTYVYQYKDSGSKYGTLLAGLALLNLGTIAAGTAYAVSHSHNSGSGGQSGYKTQPGEVCKFGLKKDNGDYEETRIDCQLISSFIFQEQAKAQQGGQQNNTTITTSVTTVTNTTLLNNTNVAQPDAVNQTATKVLYEMLANGTLVPVNVPLNNTGDAHDSAAGANNPPMTSSVVTTTNTTTVTNALDVKGKPVDVTPGMECFVIRTTPASKMRRAVPCGLLQTYAQTSFKNSAVRSLPTFALITTILLTIVSI